MSEDLIEKSKQVLANIDFNDTTYEVARDVVLDEIERLNNIINELEKWLNKNIGDIIKYFDNAPFGEEEAYRNTLRKLQELKELKDSDKE